MDEQNNTDQVSTADTGPEKTFASRMKGLSVRQKIYIGFGGLILLTALNLGFTLFKLNDIQTIGHSAIEQRQPAANLFQRLAQDLNVSTTLLNNYLITEQKDQREEFEIITQDIKERMIAAHNLDLVKSGDISTDNIKRMEELFALFMQSANKLYKLSDDNETNSGLILAQDTLNGPATQFLNITNLLLSTEEFDLTDPDALKAYKTLQALRYNWTQMMSNLRLYIVSQGPSFIPNFYNFNEQTGILLEELASMDYEIGFGEIDQLSELRAEYMENLPAVIETFKSGTYRADSFLITSELQPTLEELRQLLEGTADKLLSEASNAGKELTEAQGQISSTAILSGIIVLWFGTLLALKISGDTVPPIRRLMKAARQISDGDLNAEVMVTTNDEIGMLGRSFNKMVDDLRSAALNEYKLIEKLTELNEDLENRVEERTEELARSESKIRAVLDNIGEGILLLDENGQIESLNPSAEKIFDTTEKEAVGTNSALFIKIDDHEISKTEKQDEINQLLFTGNESSQPRESVGHRADGSSFPMEFVVSSMELRDRKMHVCIVRDITARKAAEATLADAQAQLVDAAHKSGMADMATGVLHNIGNILNSVNLASEEILRITNTSKISGLMKANELLESQEDLTDFFTNDERGKKLPGYYMKMSNVLENEISSINGEARDLIEKTTMMKEVISTQQAYAHSGFHTEQLSINELIEDALKIQIASLQKWGVKLHKSYHDIPVCIGQKSKLLQVITNLIKNAKEAMSKNDDFNKSKEMTIETGLVGEEHAYIKVTDNGCGISQSQLSRIFSHGFTTKEEGHGFGLHTSANAMTEMHGSLKVDSEGIEKGAVFTVIIPIYKKAA